ncbi:type II toxin-antitoxin system RelE/ParE family toxin [Massiliimalia massiliensis]|uniref:type II toxin-antitoxin system RelE/ParE family toxin n=1 Tax=Massiliimalia massiliensis TaxID=1852384 RepID=UPI00135642A7|nr:type II toxin-antitoxin system RelE/ParE family toxin [Massiliimalia massiliensis]
MKTTRPIFDFTDADGNAPVQEFIRKLDPKIQHKINQQLEQLQMIPCNLHPPHVKAFRLDRYKGLYELRTRINKMIRIIFFLDNEGRIILLHGFIKKRDRSTEQALAIARARKLALASDKSAMKLYKN